MLNKIRIDVILEGSVRFVFNVKIPASMFINPRRQFIHFFMRHFASPDGIIHPLPVIHSKASLIISDFCMVLQVMNLFL